jgi:hypothetical protein
VSASIDGLVNGYLSRLRAALREAPSGVRDDVLDDVGRHLREVMVERPGMSAAELEVVLSQLGDPRVIAAAAVPAKTQVRTARALTRLATALVLPLIALGTGILMEQPSPPPNIVVLPCASLIYFAALVGLTRHLGWRDRWLLGIIPTVSVLIYLVWWTGMRPVVFDCVSARRVPLPGGGFQSIYEACYTRSDLVWYIGLVLLAIAGSIAGLLRLAAGPSSVKRGVRREAAAP